MSLAFNDTTNLRGIIQQVEQELGFEPGHISGNTTLMKLFTAGVNLAWDDYVSLAIQADGRWQFDDSNHVDGSGNSTFAIVKTNLVSGRRDYKLVSDEQGNFILEIQKVAILPSSTATTFQELDLMDELTERDNDILAENTSTGVPQRCALLGDTILLETPPSYNATLGLKAYVNREPSYFTTADTTKKPGCPGIHHRYFALRAAEDYARRKTLAQYPAISAERLSMERDITTYFGRRNRDERPTITPKKTPFI